ncbi:MAG TPA: pyroglutamyl-peptidase I [Pseudolabrys sp.]|nr:pyroglutamyl-peptidase I [Pseudolabrys sp.]
MNVTILLTGFGPFPGAPFNPTEALVTQLASERRPALADVTIVPHIFRTSYAAVDRDLPALIREHRPDAILMFGLAARTRHLRIETLARNAIVRLADADRSAPTASLIAKGTRERALATPARALLAAARDARVHAAMSRDAGRYLCNYLCWRAAEASGAKNGPRFTAFIHVPLVRRNPVRAAKGRRLTQADLARAGRGFLRTIAAAARR